MASEADELVTEILANLHELAPEALWNFQPGIEEPELTKLLAAAEFDIPKALRIFYQYCDGNEFPNEGGKVVFDQDRLPILKGAFHMYSLEQVLEYAVKDSPFYPQGAIAFAGRVERDFLYIDPKDSAVYLSGLYSLTTKIANSIEEFLQEYLSGLKAGLYILDTLYEYYPRIVHKDDIGNEALYSTFDGASLGE